MNSRLHHKIVTYYNIQTFVRRGCCCCVFSLDTWQGVFVITRNLIVWKKCPFCDNPNILKDYIYRIIIIYDKMSCFAFVEKWGWNRAASNAKQAKKSKCKNSCPQWDSNRQPSFSLSDSLPTTLAGDYLSVYTATPSYEYSDQLKNCVWK